MLKINYSKKNINIISFCISLIIFLILIYVLKSITSQYSQNANIKQNKSTIKKTKNENTQNSDIELEEIKTWRIEIEKLGLVAPIREGAEENIIKESVGHYNMSNYLVGKVALKSYNIGPNKNYFVNLKELEIGDEIQYIINENKYKYKVFSNIIIEEKGEIKTDDEDLLILITYIKDMPNKRRCVIASRTK